MSYSLQALDEAYERIKPFVHRTPVLTSRSIDEITGAKIWFKCENFQKVGAFKYRGATNAILSLRPADRKRGVATHSSGNHAQAVALGAKIQGIPAWIVMPENAPKVKIAAVKGYGAEIIFCEATQHARESTLDEVVLKTAANFIHPYNDDRVILGQSTASRELMEELPEPLDILITPVGGGGLLSGSALASHYFFPKTAVIGAEPSGADDARRSFYSGEVQACFEPNTIADGLRTSLSSKTFEVIKEYVKDILIVEDELIITAMRIIWERMKIIVEPSCAVPLAVVLKYPDQFKGKKLGIILTGGNVDLGKLPF